MRSREQWGFYGGSRDEETMRRTLEGLERFGVERAVTSGSPDLMAAYAEAAPHRIIPSLMIDPAVREAPSGFEPE